MAIGIVGATFTLRTDIIDLTSFWDLPKISSSPTSYVVDESGGSVGDFTFSSVTYDTSGKPVSGTITGIEERYNGQMAFRLTNLNVGVPQFYQWTAPGANTSAIASLFGGDDTITGGTSDDYINAYAGHDVIFGGAGKDTILGGDGNDHLYGQSAEGGTDDADSIMGGEGSDYIQGNAGDDMLDGGNGSDRIYGGNGADTIIGGNGNVTLNGNAGNDSIDGGADNDFIRGGQGDDTINGGNGSDVLMGDMGNDVLVGGQGLDTMTGGAGSDTFRFAGDDAAAPLLTTVLDVVTDFVHLTDHLAIGFVPTSVLTGTAATIADARALAQTLLTAHAGTLEVAAVQVGSDTTLFWGAAGVDLVSSGVKLASIQASTIGLADFV